MKLRDPIRRGAAVIGSGLMVWGAFMPLLGINFLKDESFFELRPVGAAIIIALAAITIALALKKWYAWLYATGFVSVGLLVYAVIVLRTRTTNAHNDLEHVADSPLRSLGSSVVDSAGLRHGWVVMMLGALIILAVAILGPRLAFIGKKADDAGNE